MILVQKQSYLAKQMKQTDTVKIAVETLYQLVTAILWTL